MCECVCVCLYVFESKTEFDFAGLFYASNECCGLFKYVKSEKVMHLLAFMTIFL